MVSLISSILSFIFMPFLIFIQLVVAVAFKLFVFFGGFYMVAATVLMLWMEDSNVYPVTLQHGVIVCMIIAGLTLLIRFIKYIRNRHYRQLDY